MSKTSIEWCDYSFNPWWGCGEISPGCDNCYARSFAARFGVKWGIETPRRAFGDKHWNEPLKWDTAAAKSGRHARVFCASMADVFDKNAPLGARERLWRLIDETPNLDWQLLTKRIGNVHRMIPQSWLLDGWPSNVWLGITVVNQEEADRDIPKLLGIPAAVRFLSCEPLLGPVDLTGYHLADRCGGEYPFKMLPHEHRTTRAEMLDWVISGGESGPKARPSHPDWHRSLRDQCAAAGVAFHFKQFGEWAPTQPVVGGDLGGDMRRGVVRIVKAAGENDGHLRAGDVLMRRVGKKAAGRELDGRTHDDFPERTA
jgi:protein gp37